MTRAELRALVIEATRRSDKASLINDAINFALADISSQHLWSDLLVEATATLTEGSTSVSLAADVARVTEVRILDESGTPSWPLQVRPKSWVVRKFPNPSAGSQGRPNFGYLEGTTLSTVPVPDVDYTVRYSYYRIHPNLTSDGSSTLVRGIDPAVIAYATHWVFQSIEKYEEARRWLEIYAMKLTIAKKVDKDNSVVQSIAESRDEQLPANHEYWLDPLVRRMP